MKNKKPKTNRYRLGSVSVEVDKKSKPRRHAKVTITKKGRTHTNYIEN